MAQRLRACAVSKKYYSFKYLLSCRLAFSDAKTCFRDPRFLGLKRQDRHLATCAGMTL